MMKERLYIHVGYGRTGTTLLQNRFFPQHDAIHYLGKTKTDYPRWLIDWQYLDHLAFEQNMADIRKTVLQQCCGHRLNLISSEAFTMQGGYAAVQAERIGRIVPDARIILVLRDPVEMVKSLYKFYLKAFDFIGDIEDFLDDSRSPLIFYRRRPIYLADLLYDEIIEVYCGLFKPENVCILRYEEMVADPIRFFDDLGHFLSVEFTREFIEEHLKRKENASPQQTELAAIKANNLSKFVRRYVPEESFSLDASALASGRDDCMVTPALEKKLTDFFRGKTFGYY